MNEKNLNNKNRINNSKKMDFDNVVLQHKKEYMVKKWRTKIYKGGLRSRFKHHYIRFFTENKKKLFPSAYNNSYYRTNKSQKLFEPHIFNYCRYYRLYKRYQKLKRIKLFFTRFRFRERITYEYWSLRYVKLRKERYSPKRGRDRNNKKFYWKKIILTPFKYLLLLRYQELLSLGKGPFTDTSYYHMENPKMSLDFHRFFLNQYHDYLFTRNDPNLDEKYLTLKNYFGSEKYIHDVLYTMPGVRWNDTKFNESIEKGFFELKTNNHDISNYLSSDFLEIGYVNALNMEAKNISNRLKGTFCNITYHLEHDNSKLFMNPNLTDLDEKAPMWKAMMRVWFGFEKVTFIRLFDDYYFFTIKYYYLWIAFFFFPAFPTTATAPARLIQYYKPWVKNPRYEPYIGTLFLPFQKDRYEKEVQKKKKRLNISIFTKFIVFSFFIYVFFI